MTNTYTWNYLSSSALNQFAIDGVTLTDVVLDVFFSITVTDGTNTTTFNANDVLPEPTSPDGFVPSNEVTKATIMGWLNTMLTARDAAQAAYVTAEAAYQAAKTANPEDTDTPPVAPANGNRGLLYYQAQADAALAAKIGPQIVAFTPAA